MRLPNREYVVKLEPEDGSRFAFSIEPFAVVPLLMLGASDSRDSSMSLPQYTAAAKTTMKETSTCKMRFLYKIKEPFIVRSNGLDLRSVGTVYHALQVERLVRHRK